MEDEEVGSGLSFFAFVDAHYALQTADVGSENFPGHRAYVGASPNPDADFGYANDNGFALNFLGLDAIYDQRQYGATISLRAGPKMRRYHFNSQPEQFGIENVTQAFVTYRPVDAVAFDLGMFGTIFGAEVLESWLNLNYTRGALYFAAQPFWHTGLRASVAANDTFSITGMITNDANTAWNTDNPNANNPVFSLKFGLTPSDMLSISLGGMMAADKDTASGLETFADLVVVLTVEDFTAILNADYNLDRSDDEVVDDASIYGVSLALGYQFTPIFGAAVRGEYVGGDWFGEESLVTGTATLDFKPVQDSDNLVIRLEGRYETQTDGFTDRDGEPSDSWMMATLGAVVTTD